MEQKYILWRTGRGCLVGGTAFVLAIVAGVGAAAAGLPMPGVLLLTAVVVGPLLGWSFLADRRRGGGPTAPLILLLLALPPFGTPSLAAPPAPPAREGPLLDDLRYASPAAVKAAWPAMEGSPAAEVVTLSGRRALRLRCDFSGTKVERASWDHALSADLSACRGIRFDFFCADASPVSRFSLYFRSGGGWYAASFAAPDGSGFREVVVDRTGTRIEGSPAGWSRIDGIRISAWRGGDADAEFLVANLSVLGPDAEIALVRGEAAAGVAPGEAAAAAEYAAGLGRMLDRLGLPYAVLSDLDATPERLAGKKVAILPYDPGLPDAAAAALARFMDGGGKVLAFYALDPALAAALSVTGGEHVPEGRRGRFAAIRAVPAVVAGLPESVAQASWNIRRTGAVEGKSRVAARWYTDAGEDTGEAAVVVSAKGAFVTHVLLPDDPDGKERLLLALLGHLAPDLWEKAVRAKIDGLGRFGPYAGFDEAAAALGAVPRAAEALGRAVAGRADASARAAKADWPAALSAAGEADAALLLAHCRAQEGKPGERRAFWCHDAYGVPGLTWDEAARRLKENGFTAVIANLFWAGASFGASEVLPVAPEVATRGDAIAECVAAGRKHGLEVHAWKVNFNLGGRAPPAFAERMRREGRTQVAFDGREEPNWLCPSHPGNRKLEIESMLEVAAKYDVDGLHFDYIRYPGPNHCFCAGCRERFEAALGRKVARWPADCRADEATRAKWLDFRRDNITAVVKAVAEGARRRKPGMKISAAVFPDWPVHRDEVGQDWRLWCERGWLDFVCPMDYTESTAAFAGQVSRQVAWAGQVPVCPGIGLSTWGAPRDVPRLLDQIAATRRLGAAGFTIFNYGSVESAFVLPLLGAGITR